MSKQIFDKLSYKTPVRNKSLSVTRILKPLLTKLKRNEGVLFVLDLIPSNYGLYSLEINTNSAFDDDMVEWTDFRKLCGLISNWEYKNVIVLVEESQSDFNDSKWYKALEKQVDKIQRDLYKPSVKFEVVKDITNIWDFKYDSQDDFILRIAWDKSCIIDRLASDKRAWNRFIGDTKLYEDHPKYYSNGEGESIFEKDKWFVFKKRKVDKKNGIGIYKFDNEKDFEDRLKEFDYVESFIESDIDEETGFNIEIKDYLMVFKKSSYHLTPNIYTQYWDYIKPNENELRLVRVSKGNILTESNVELIDGTIVKALDLNTDSILKKGGRVVEIENSLYPIHQKYVLVNDQYKLCHSASVLCSNGKFTPSWSLEVGDELLVGDKSIKIESKEIVHKSMRTRYIKTENNSFGIDGLQISSKSDNFVLGSKKQIIYNPENQDSVLSFDEKGVVDGIMSNVQDQKMPDRVVEITFESHGTFFQSEFLFEKPLKVINSQDKEIRRDRMDGLEPYGTHTEGGGTKSRPTFGWASYRPDLTKEIKDMEVMKLRPGMMCLTPKRKDMKFTTELYGEMIPCKVVSMREMIGKRSHWDIYNIVPTENYFMNRMHVHNGPSNSPIINGPQLIGNWEAGHSSSVPNSGPGQIATWFDLTTRLNMDLGNDGPSPTTESLKGNTKIPGPGFPNFNGIIVPEVNGYVAEKQPSNPYHTQTLFNSQVTMTFIMAVSVTHTSVSNQVQYIGFNPSAPTMNRFVDIGPGVNMTAGPGPSGKIRIYTSPQYYSAPSVTDLIPGGVFYPSGRAQVAKMRMFWMKFDQGPAPYVSAGFDRDSTIAPDTAWFSGITTPQSNPRSPSTDFAIGGSVQQISQPSYGGNFVISHCMIYDGQLPKAECAEIFDSWRGTGNNDQIMYDDGA